MVGQQVEEGDTQLPISGATRQVSQGKGDAFFSNVSIGGTELRILTFPVPGLLVTSPTGSQTVETGAIQLARPLNAVNSILSDLRLVLLVVLLAGMAVAAALGRIASRRVLAPLAEVAAVAQEIGETDDLSKRLQRPRRRRGRPARHQLQLHARPPGVLTRRAGRFGPRPAPARGRRVA